MRSNRLDFSLSYVLLAALLLSISILACNFNPGNNDLESLEQTSVALEATLNALPESEEEHGAVTELPSPTITPTATEEIITKDTEFDFTRMQLSWDTALVGQATPTTIHGENPGEGYMPASYFPTHIEIHFPGYPVTEEYLKPVLRIYPVADFKEINPFVTEIIANLKTILANQPEGGVDAQFPFVPPPPAHQVFAAQVRYVDFQTGTCVCYVTSFAQDLYPIDNLGLEYTCQGLTQDGRLYIAAEFPINAAILPDDGASIVEDWAQFEDNWSVYLTDTVQALNAQPSSGFTPDLARIDDTIRSLEISFGD